jgi:hypothetical protein
MAVLFCHLVQQVTSMISAAQISFLKAGPKQELVLIITPRKHILPFVSCQFLMSAVGEVLSPRLPDTIF